MNGDFRLFAHAARWLDRISRCATHAKTRWAAAVVALALMPKCVVCVAAYFALVTGFGVVDRELCGGETAAAVRGLRGFMVAGTWPWIWSAVVVVGLAAAMAWTRLRTPARSKSGNAEDKRGAHGM